MARLRRATAAQDGQIGPMEDAAAQLEAAGHRLVYTHKDRLPCSSFGTIGGGLTISMKSLPLKQDLSASLTSKGFTIFS